MTGDERRAIEADCARLIALYANRNDAADWQGVVALYAEDGLMTRPTAPDAPIIGRAAILAAFHSRPPRKTRHVCSNVVIDVLSPSTQQADLTRKRWAFQDIPTLQAILFVAADEPRVELSVRGVDGAWVSTFVTGLDAEVPLGALGLTLPMAELYAGADLGAAAA